jgi:hypothetical protein
MTTPLEKSNIWCLIVGYSKFVIDPTCSLFLLSGEANHCICIEEKGKNIIVRHLRSPALWSEINLRVSEVSIHRKKTTIGVATIVSTIVFPPLYISRSKLNDNLGGLQFLLSLKEFCPFFLLSCALCISVEFNFVGAHFIWHWILILYFSNMWSSQRIGVS